MELLVSVPWNSMEPIVCYLMEPLVSSIHWVSKWDRIPWNLSFQILMKIIFNCAGSINFRKLTNTLYLFVNLFHQLMYVLLLIFALYHMHSRHYSLRIKISFKISFQYSLKLILIKKFHGTFSWVPWNFLNKIWTTPVVPWNSMELEQQNLKFHGILWNSLEFCPDPKFHGTFSILPSSMAFHGTFNFPQKRNSMELFNSMD